MVIYFNKEEVTVLLKQGLGIVELSKALHCNYDTIKKYLIKEFPDYMTKWKKHYFDNETFEKLCSIFCTTEEIAFFMNMSVTKLKKRCEYYYNAPYSTIYLKYTTNAVISLRRKKYQLAENGNLFALNSLLKNAEKKELKYNSPNLKVSDYNIILLEIFQNENNTPSDRLSAYDRLMKLSDEKQKKSDEIIFINDVSELPKPEMIEQHQEESQKIQDSEKL